jgi:ceramide glucosyltransferase
MARCGTGGLRRVAAGGVSPQLVIYGVIAAVAAAYQVVAMIACFRGTGHEPRAEGLPASILKPIRGLDSALRAAIESHMKIEGEFELLCGVQSLEDPAVALLREFPKVRVVECRTTTPNGKVGRLVDLALEARFPTLVVNDADICVEPDYLARVTAPLRDPRVGLVTCLYRPEGSTFAARFEGLGVSTEFAPSTLVARMVGVDEFAMGSTLAFRRADLERMGGFDAIKEYLADDYQLGARLHALGLKCVLSDAIVSTHLGGGWGDVWRHQLRWARTIRVSKRAGYLGLPVTFATVWAAAAAAGGFWEIAAGLLVLRMLMALTSGWLVLRSRDVVRLWWLIPARDLFGAAVWIAGLFGNTVVWRGQKLRLDREGRIVA